MAAGRERQRNYPPLVGRHSEQQLPRVPIQQFQVRPSLPRWVRPLLPRWSARRQDPPVRREGQAGNGQFIGLSKTRYFLVFGERPQPQTVIAHGEDIAIRREGEGRGRPHLGAGEFQRKVGRQGERPPFLPGLYLPNVHRDTWPSGPSGGSSYPAGGRQAGAVPGKRHRTPAEQVILPAVVADLEAETFGPGGGVPKKDAAVVTRNERLAVRREGERVHRIAVAWRRRVPKSPHVPDLTVESPAPDQ